MKTTKHFLFASMALVLLLMCAGAGPANAQGLNGTFTLPFVTQWGGVTLPAGEYSFTMDRPNHMLYVSQGLTTIAMILPQTIDWRSPDDNALVVEQGDGVNCIRELRLAGSGAVLRYAPKLSNRKVLQEFSMLVPITR